MYVDGEQDVRSYRPGSVFAMRKLANRCHKIAGVLLKLRALQNLLERISVYVIPVATRFKRCHLKLYMEGKAFFQL
jgi:hypothetical protein